VIVDPTINRECFWTDRWMGSRAFLLPLEPRGLYREMLTAAWFRGAELPADEDQVRRLILVTEAEWARTWSTIARYWQTVDGRLVNPQQQRIYRETQARHAHFATLGAAGARKRWRGGR
jgi:uncharacterized protein YdaU (DUF1376 family)